MISPPIPSIFIPLNVVSSGIMWAGKSQNCNDVDIPENGTWNMVGVVILDTVALDRRQIPGSIDDADIGVIEILGKPFGFDEGGD